MEVVELLKELVKLDTRNPPGKTSEIAEYIAKIFSSYNCRFYEKVDGKTNLVIEINKGKPTLMLNSHLDTVPAEDILLNPIIVNGKLYGRGSCDAKASVAAMISAALKVQPECGLKVVFTADEEVGGANGLGYVFQRDSADAVVIGEPTGLNCIGVLQAAVISLDIDFRGKSGHSAFQNSEYGAIFKAAKYITEKVKEFERLRGDYTHYKEFFASLGFEFSLKSWEAVFNPAIIQGGIKRNVVAESCKIKADIRFAPWLSSEGIKLSLKRFDDIEYRFEGFLPPYGVKYDNVKIEDDIKMLKLLGSVVRSFSLTPKALFSLGVGDTRHVRKHGVPAFYYGPSGGNMHAENEFVRIDELKKFVDAYINIINKFPEFFRKS
ncbi:MAG: M20 family metallopeptidase [Archaeoglobales archaeon]|nr:M20 family metallopeptidase [Archaeoglobales archaeon]